MENSVFADLKKDKYLTKKDRSTPLDQAMLFATFDLHRAVENKPFVQTMIMKTITRAAYAGYVSQLYFIYKTMEDVGELCQGDPIYGALYFPVELNREKAIVDDLIFFYGENWQSKIKKTPAITKYVDRISYLSENKPALLLAHNFVRYFGDMSGGQVLKYKMRKCLNLPDDEQGVHLYDFENIVDSNKFMQFYISRLNSLELTNSMYDEMLEEARNAFQLNMDVFEDLEILFPSMTINYYSQLRSRLLEIPYSDKVWKTTVILLALAIIAHIIRSNVEG